MDGLVVDLSADAFVWTWTVTGGSSPAAVTAGM